MSENVTKTADYGAELLGTKCPACGALAEIDGTCSVCGHEPPDPRIGLVVADKYVIDERIGEGGMGAVYRATHLELGEPVAVKFLLGGFARTTEIRTRFRREAVALARLRHPGVVSVLDFGEHQDDLFLVMELVRGTSFAETIHPRGVPMPLIRLGPIFDQLLQVLEATHAAKLVHRDIKPENVMLTDTGDRTDRVKLLDFGLVRLDDGNDGGKVTRTGQVQGTPYYMSPEQCRGVDVGAATDVYAVGVMLYEALAGVPPFDGGEPAVVMAQHMFVDPEPLATVGVKPSVSPGLEAVVHAAMAKRAADRPTAAELRDQLAAALKGTDPLSLATAAAAERARIAAMSRSERALTGVRDLETPVARPKSLDAQGRVVLWLGTARAASLRNALSVNGAFPEVWTSAAPPAGLGEHDLPTLVVVSADEDGEARTRLLRAHESFGWAPVLVVDVAGAAQTSLYIRAGASDVTLVGVGDDEILRKSKRLIQRGR